ncbi:MAG: bifunctional homocysteine S-methyltransferase/methylenetetrahydrofolate reductase [Nitrospinota bacterium]
MGKSFSERLKQGVLVCDGAMGTMLYSKGVYIDRSFDALNLTAPDLVREVHRSYIKSGADIIETNTFGANRFKLRAHGLEGQVREINRQGALLAREESREAALVAGAVGPLGVLMEPLGKVRSAEAREAFREQAEGLLDGGVDLFILETFVHLEELGEAIGAVREACTGKGKALPIIAQMTLGEDGNTLHGIEPERVARQIERWGVEVLGANCSVGPAPMLESIRRMRSATSLPLSAQPNAGTPALVDGRYIYLTSPEYLATYAQRFIQVGVRVLGGCCGTTPAHIAAVRRAVRAMKPSREEVRAEPKRAVLRPEPKTVPRAEKSPLAQKLSEGRFVVSVELLPPRGADPGKVLESARLLKEARVDAVNIPDGPRASARMSPLALALLLMSEAGLEPILHYTCRDRNLLGMQSDILGAHALGIRNMLIVTGDPPKLGDYPEATAVYDVDSIGLVRLISRLNRGEDVAGNTIGTPTAVHIGVGVNPGAMNLEEEIRRFRLKVEGGAEFALTQPVFELGLLEKFLERTEGFRIPILVGILPLASYRAAEFLHNEVPGMSIPKGVLERMRKARSGDEARAIGIEVAQEALLKTRTLVQGAYVMSPVGGARGALKVLEVLS